MTKLLMVCMGNLCRSPMAQTVAEKLAADAGLSQQLKLDSAGTHAPHLGERPDPRVEVTLSRRGYEMGRIRSRRIAPQDFQHFDLILAMDASNLAELQRLCPLAHLSKLRLFLDFAEGLNETEVPDPYYGNSEGFERVLDLCEAGASGLIKHYTL
ncbi:MAG TPA: phosphotyrosine protein phosphatase [Polaromonas sp.]|uniref:low molecular weight protein-tyrosine-phosphatase n=1 Tax=Polaromonas sp. UBA4122 TaxID=1947074 RepID=UPI000EB9B11A|nr:low molecular weight protein-tyrosine-phosphatase [Polaromonas sp. UBA4122]HAL39696.1 phosphotyrosine protein phosphatase [Polaromonas sp.]